MTFSCKKLKEVATINPRRPSIERDNDVMTSFVPMENVDEVMGAVATLSCEPFSKVKKGYTYFEDGDVIFAKITPCMQNGKHAVLSGLIDGFGFGSTEFHVIRPGEEITSEWIHFFLRRKETLNAAMNTFTGAVGQQRVPEAFLEELEIPLPHPDVQKRIVGSIKMQLAEVETARQATETAFSDVESLKAAVFSTTFNQIVPVAPPKNLPTAPDGWQWKKLTDIAELESGHTPSRFRPDWWGGDISWVSLTEIRSLDGMWVEETQLRTNKDGIANSSARILPKGTVCFSRTASVGFVAIMAKPMSTSQDFANWVCGENLDPEFLMYALLRSRDDLRAIAEGATHKTIYMPALHSFHICVPDPSEQRRLVASLREELKSIEVVRVALEKQLSELKQLPNRILAQAFES